MWTVQSFTDEIVKEKRSRVVRVIFTNGKEDLTETFRFSVKEDDVKVKKVVVQYLDELNFVFVPITGDITDVPTEPTPVEPTAEELAEQKLQEDRNILEQSKKDVELGLLTQAEYDAKLTAIKMTGIKEVETKG